MSEPLLSRWKDIQMEGPLKKKLTHLNLSHLMSKPKNMTWERWIMKSGIVSSIPEQIQPSSRVYILSISVQPISLWLNWIQHLHHSTITLLISDDFCLRGKPTNINIPHYSLVNYAGPTDRIIPDEYQLLNHFYCSLPGRETSPC